jgi:hypothetical protein
MVIIGIQQFGSSRGMFVVVGKHFLMKDKSREIHTCCIGDWTSQMRKTRGWDGCSESFKRTHVGFLFSKQTLKILPYIEVHREISY